MEIILAVDPSLRGTGYAVVSAPRVGGAPRCHEYGVLRLAPNRSVPSCLLEIHDTLEEVIRRQKVQTLVIESTIYVQSYQTAILLGSARGAALLAAARHGLAVREFAPRKVKQAVVGRGHATKEQVAFMVRTIYGLEETPPPDAADALAVGQTYLQSLAFQNALPCPVPPRRRRNPRRPKLAPS